MEKPTLPSIQFLLQETSAPPPPPPQPQQHKRPGRHGYSKSLSTLPEDLAGLSLQGPWQGSPLMNGEDRPSWMLPVDHLQQQQQMTQLQTQQQHQQQLQTQQQPLFTTNTLSTPAQRQPHAGHGRSRSDFSMAPLLAAPSPPTINRHHRRAVSANNMADIMVKPPSPQPMDAEGRYTCPFCQKKFSRPSSLKIHTYSHTGEKPFACPEPGCGRHFSVQSNMRRHMKIHRNRVDEDL